MSVLRSRGQRIVYDVVGDGPSVVFLHGISNHRWVWAPQVATVTQLAHRAVLVDLAGHGQSDPVVDTTTASDLATDVVSLLDELEEAQAVTDLVTGSRFEVVRDSGHLVNLERPDVFNKVLIDLVSGGGPL